MTNVRAERVQEAGKGNREDGAEDEQRKPCDSGRSEKRAHETMVSRT